MSACLVAEAAGFIASRATHLSMDAGHTVTGVDNLNDCYDVRLKELRPAAPSQHPDFSFVLLDIEQLSTLELLFWQ